MSRPLLMALALAHGTTNAGALAERLAEAWGHELCAPGDPTARSLAAQKGRQPTGVVVGGVVGRCWTMGGVRCSGD
ncbi:MAG TPA: hypothetical protein VF120_08365 [Ktedonobacterales bacterium]